MTLHSHSTRELIRLRTGQDDCRLLFRARHYQLRHEGSNQRIELGYAGSRVLERLLQNPGEVVSRDELLEYGWTDRVVSQGSLNQQIYVLRQLLGDEKGRNIIQTLPRRGYLFNPEFVEAGTGAAPLSVSPTAYGDKSGRRALPNWLKLGGLIALTPLLATCAAHL
jgi:DNA-binding winged helix-turn-helix (wHTH) protein